MSDSANHTPPPPPTTATRRVFNRAVIIVIVIGITVGITFGVIHFTSHPHNPTFTPPRPSPSAYKEVYPDFLINASVQIPSNLKLEYQGDEGCLKLTLNTGVRAETKLDGLNVTGEATIEAFFGQPNFGVIEVNWDAKPVSLRFEVRGVSGEAVNSVTTSLRELQGSNTKKMNGKQQYCSLEVDLPWLVRHRLALLFSFSVAVVIVVQIGVLYMAITLMVKCLRKCKLD